MKFLVLALCVCAASAATYKPNVYSSYKPYKPPQQPAKAYTPVASPFVQASRVATSGPVVAAAAAYGARPSRVGPVAPVAPAKAYTGNDAEAGILRSESEVTNEGYNYHYETANGIASHASGVLKNVDGTDAVVSQGFYRYTAPDGTPVEFSYIADENGYQPQGNLLPVAPPVPEAILRSLEYIRNHPSPNAKNY